MTNPMSTGEWLREPAHAMVEDERVRFTTSPGTDLWQRTYYGFRNDNAPSLLLPASSNMTLTVRVSFQYRRRYDQAGVLVHLNPIPGPRRPSSTRTTGCRGSAAW